MTRLTVCWNTPPEIPDGPILSFLPPIEEEALARRAKGTFLRARACSPSARAAAREAYVRVSAAIGAAAMSGRPTLRAECGDNSWWYHPTSFKDCETDKAFPRLIAIRAILEAAASAGAAEIETWGAPAEVAAVLRGRMTLAERRSAAPFSTLGAWLRGAASRLAFAADALADIFAARAASSPPIRRDVLLLGYWDWSASPDGPDGVCDRYFKAFPDRLRGREFTVGWLCWLDPGGDPLRPRRGRLAAARDAARRGVTLLQSYLSAFDVLSVVLNIRPLLAYIRRRDDAQFRAVFQDDGLDLFPLFEEFLLRGFVDASIPRAALVERAARRAAAELRPRAAAHFLEHYPQARACFAGFRAGCPAALTVAVQHGTFCSEKTFYALEPEFEFRGRPDGRAVPTPDLVFAMGLKSRAHFLSHGYSAERVLATGAPRFDHVRPPAPAKKRTGPGARVLLVPAIDLDMEAQMLDAARAAAEGLPGVELRLREHPFARPRGSAAYVRARNGLERSTETFDADIDWADVALFTYSTVGEEAVLRGVPAWQWRPIGYDASALSEAADIPRFSDVAALRDAFKNFRSGDGLPDEAARRALLADLFLSGDGQNAARAAEALDQAIKSRTQ